MFGSLALAESSFSISWLE